MNDTCRTANLLFRSLKPCFFHDRFDDPLMLDRFRMAGPSSALFPFAHPGLLPPPGIHPLLAPMLRYPPEFLAQQYMSSYMSAAASAKLSTQMSSGNCADRYSRLFNVIIGTAGVNVGISK